jgi:hypothetical protein
MASPAGELDHRLSSTMTPMVFGLLADLVVAVHLAFVFFVVLGGLLVLRWPALAWVHVPAALWGVAIELGGWICPLTPLENWLRHRGGLAAYEGGFVERYLLPVLYPGDLTRGNQLVLGLGVLVVNLAVYGWLWHRKYRRSAGKAES